MKLLNKYSFVNLVVMIFIFVLSSVLIYLLIQLILVREMDADLSGIEVKITDYVKQYNAFPQGNPLDEERLSFEVMPKGEPARNVKLVELFSSREKKLHNFRKLEFPLFYNEKWYRVTIAKPVEGMHHLSRALFIVSLTTILIIILISLFLNRFFLSKLWQPFYESISIMRNFKIGASDSLSFPKTDIEEFSFMNEGLSIASNKAKKDYLLLKEFTENASHEMQTPLSIIRSKLDVLIQDKELSEKQSELAKGAYASIKKLARLNQSLLLLAKIENQQFDINQYINLEKKVSEKVNQFYELWESHEIKTRIELNNSSIKMNAELIEILLNNLFSNAINHNLVPGYIFIELGTNHFVIKNAGASEPLDQSRLFNRFYKASSNSSRNGLGLSIISQICKVSNIKLNYSYESDLHNFRLQWESNSE